MAALSRSLPEKVRILAELLEEKKLTTEAEKIAKKLAEVLCSQEVFNKLRNSSAIKTLVIDWLTPLADRAYKQSQGRIQLYKYIQIISRKYEISKYEIGITTGAM